MRGQLESDPACQMKLCPIVQAIGAEWITTVRLHLAHKLNPAATTHAAG